VDKHHNVLRAELSIYEAAKEALFAGMEREVLRGHAASLHCRTAFIPSESSWSERTA
jgi:hypothetical protein